MPVTDATESAAPIAIEFGEHHAGEIDALIEGLGGAHRVLADHRVDHEQDLVRLHGVADVSRLLHQRLVHAESAGGVDDHRVVQLLPRVFDRVARHLHRVAGRLARGGNRVAARGLHALLRRVDGHAGALADDLELRHRVRALQIGRHEQRRMARILEPVAELARERRLAGALQTREHDDRGRVLREVERAIDALAQDVGELVIDDLHHLLCRVERFGDLGAERALAYARGERAHHVERDVRIEQRAADLADRAVDVRFGELAFALEMLERVREPVCKRTKCCHNEPILAVAWEKGGIVWTLCDMSFWSAHNRVEC